jgi:dCMP deaminase
MGFRQMGNILENDFLYLNIAKLVAERSKANRKKVGAVLVKNKNIVSFGWNGTPSGFNNACEDDNNCTLSLVVHAEANAICKAAKMGLSIEGADLYLTLSPCIECIKLIIQSGIKRVIFSEKYRDFEPIKYLKQAKIKVDFIPFTNV